MSGSASDKPLRVAQWATGNIGLRSLREVIADPRLELVGVLVFDPEKAGVDAGELCGGAPVGVVATTDPHEIIDLGADCVLHMPRLLELDHVVALLDAGTNVITTRGEFFAGGSRLDDADRKRVLDACARTGTSIYATGSSPGFITETLPLALLSLERRVESIAIEEFANMSRRDSPHMIFEQMGFGQPVDSYDSRRASYLLGEFGPPLGELAAAAGRFVDEWTSVGEVAAAREDTEILAGTIPAGTVAAQRTRIVGLSDGSDVVSMCPTWYCTTNVEPEWDLRPTGWRVRVRGDVPLDVGIEFPVPLEAMAATTPSYTANRPVNAIPHVCAARPGILDAFDLPPITPTGMRAAVE